MQKEGEELQAEGIVGVQLNERSHGWGSHVIEFFAVGTAVMRIRTTDSDPAAELRPTLDDAPRTGADRF